MLKIIRSQIFPLMVCIRFISSSKIMEHTKKINSEPYNCSHSLLQTRNCANTSPTNIISINTEQLKKMINQNEALIIDVRTKEELAATGVLPNSHNIPLNEISTAFNLTPKEFLKKYNIPKPDKDLQIVFSCARGIRSLKAGHYIANLGYKNIFNFTDGWYGWVSHNK